MNTHLGRRHPLWPQSPLALGHNIAGGSRELIPISEALHSAYKKIIQARLRAMQRLNGTSWSSANSAHSDRSPFVGNAQPELRAMIAHQSTTMLFTVFGNLLMIFVILRNNYLLRRKRITPVQMLMLHMCTSDLLFALITIFPTLLMTITVPNFHGPDFLCKFVKFVQVLPMYSSSFLLVAISADRFNAICRPLANMRSSRYNRPMLYATMAWIMAFLFSTPQFFVFGKNVQNDCTGKYTEPWQYALYVIIFNVVVWLLPSSIAGSLYFCVCRAVWRSMAFEKRCTTPPTRTECSRTDSGRLMIRSASACNDDERQRLTIETTRIRQNSTNTLVHHSGLRIQREELDRKRVQTVKLTLTIVAANFLLWAPFCVISVIDAVHPTFLSPVFATYIMFFGNLNSAVNPWIWFIFNRDMVRAALTPIFDDRKDLNRSRLSDFSTAEPWLNSRAPLRTLRDRRLAFRVSRSQPTQHLGFSRSNSHRTAATTMSAESQRAASVVTVADTVNFSVDAAI